MFDGKIKVTWLLTALVLTSLLMITGFYFFNLRGQFEKFNFPIRGLKFAPHYKMTIAGQGADSTVNGPLAVAVGTNRVYITDSKGHRINVYDKKGKYLFSFGQEGTKEGEFVYPNALALDSQSNIYVGEFQNQRIQIFEPSGKYLRTISTFMGTVITPLAIAIHNDFLYVADRSGQILVMSLEGQYIRKFGQPGSTPGLLNYPNGLAVSADGRLFISDSGNSRVQVFTTGGRYLETLDTSQYELGLPRGIAVDDLGQLYIVDTFNHNVLVYDEDLKYQFSFGDRGMEEGQFNFPNGITVDSDYKIYVTDRENNRVQVYSYQ